MKNLRLLLLLLVASLSFTVGAQTRVTNVRDSVLTTSTQYKVGRLAGSFESFGVQYTGTKYGSGTVAGYVYLEGSLDNVNFKGFSDSLTLTNVSTAQSKIWTFATVPYSYFRVVIVPTSGTWTQSAWFTTRSR